VAPIIKEFGKVYTFTNLSQWLIFTRSDNKNNLFRKEVKINSLMCGIIGLENQDINKGRSSCFAKSA